MFEAASDKRKAHLWRYVASVFLTFVAPIAVLGGLMALSQPRPDGANIDLPWYLETFLCLAPGLLGIEILPVQRMSKAALTAFYVPLAGFMLIYASLLIACGFYGGCL